jgi:hypothetical protein
MAQPQNARPAVPRAGAEAKSKLDASQPPRAEKSKPAPRKSGRPADAQRKNPPGALARPEGALERSALAQFIDKAIQQQLTIDKVPASPRADDAEFLRRVYLDITGVIPPAEKVVAFLDSKDPAKRAKVIDDLLASPAYGRHMADIWQNMLLPRNSDNRRLQSEPLHKWLSEAFNDNKGWDKVVSDFLTATGPVDKNGAVTFYLANPTPDKVTDIVTRLFLGVQLQCAQCHNHPFTSWKQDEYWGMAAFFSKVRMNGKVKGAAKKGITLAIDETGKGKGPKLPVSALRVPPKFLQGEQPRLDRNTPYRPVLAKWLTSPENPFFARAMVNRMWGHFFGRGFVNPVDDMHDKNPASHPVLLDVLAGQFAKGGFDVKDLARAICNSQTYQRTSKPVGDNENDDALFSHMAIKVMSPEQLFDSLESVVGGQKTKPRAAANGKKPNPAKKKNPAGARMAFVTFFQTEDGADPTEFQWGIPQALRLMNSPQLSNGAALLNKVLTKKGQSPGRVIEQLYLATLSRRPTAQETTRLTAYVAKQDGPSRKAYSDILWALLNSSEFSLNH